MSAPPGWHLQPDGRERWWDGQQWTDQYRAPLPSDPTAPPPWDDGRTQALDVDRTQALPQQPPGGSPGAVPPAGPTSPVPPQPTPYGAPGYGAPGYGAPGSYPPPRRGMSGGAKGCLIAALTVLVLIAIAAVAGVIWFARNADTISESITSSLPTPVPSEVIPSDQPTSLPSIGGESVTIGVGDAFELPRASIAAGWTVQSGSFGSEVSGMTATFTGEQSIPVVFSLEFTGTDGGSVPTVCTATPDSSTATTAEVSCLPVFGEVDPAGKVVVTPAF